MSSLLPRRSRRRATLLDVARAAGVSKTVASRALAGYGDVAAATRERVTTFAQELGYHASARALALAAGKDAPARCAVLSLGMTSVQFGRSFYGPVLAGIAAQASVEAMDVHLLTLPGDATQSAEALDRLVAEDRAEGFILLTFLSLTPDHVRALDVAGIPYVLVNRDFGERPVNCVTPDWREATCSAVEHLAKLGHRRLVAVLPNSSSSAIRDREQGWRAGISRYALDESETRIVRFTGSGRSGAYRLVRQILTEGAPNNRALPTGVVCFDDYCAHGVLAAAVEAGVRVPDQLSVISFDNVISGYTTPPVCSFDPHLHDLGAAAASLLATALRGELEAPQRVLLPLELICRESCAPAPAALPATRAPARERASQAPAAR